MCVAIKPVAPVLEVDWLTGRVRTDPRHVVRTRSDEAACAVGYALGAALGCAVVVVAASGPAAEGVLRAALAEGAIRAVRVVIGDDDRDASDPAEQWGSGVVAAALSAVATGARAVVCGDASGDRGSGTVPARLAHLLALPQALCLRAVAAHGTELVATRRLDGGRRERLRVDVPCVVSVESAAASAPRAALPRVVDTTGGTDAYEVVVVAVPESARRGDPMGSIVGPHRPRPSLVAAPRERDAVRRAVELAGTLSHRDPPELLRCDPDEAADAILEHLERWRLR